MFSFKTYIEAPHFIERADEIGKNLLPSFVLANPNEIKNWSRLQQEFPAYQAVIIDEYKQPIGVINTVPVTWQGTLETLPEESWDWALANPKLDGNWHCVLFVAILPEYRGQGLAEEALQTAKRIGQAHKHQGTIVPVRPTCKERFPYMPMETYLEKRHEDGKMYDPWLRLHFDIGAQLIKICHRAVTIQLPLEDWHKYGAAPSPNDPDKLIVPGGLVPVKILPEQNAGVYEEPNVLLLHEYQSTPKS
jgi:GNAT superfamily N-acetyltransferase